MDIYLVRHGHSTGNGQERFMGWSDHPLDESGTAQARAVANRLAPLGPMEVVSSDLPRARMTAEITAMQWDVAVNTDPRWREVSSGSYEGRSWSAFSQDTDLVRQFELDPFNAHLPDGESAAMMCARVTAAFEEILSGTVERVAIFTHDGPIRAVLAHCLGIPPQRFWTLTTSHGGITLISQENDWLSVRFVNNICHLDTTS